MADRQMYYPLDQARKEIRLLRLFGSTDDGPVHAQLDTVSFLSDNRPSYEAISYRWAEVSGQREMILNGLQFDAPASAVKVLRQFRPKDPNGFRLIWIDAVCINQSDLVEKGQQVQIMGEIYKSCSGALIWLGDFDDSVDEAVKSLNIVLNEIRERTDNFEKFEEVALGKKDRLIDGEHSKALIRAGFNFQVLDNFLEREWFTRLWVCTDC